MKWLRFVYIMLCVSMFMFAQNVQAASAVSFGYGRGTKQVEAYRVNAARSWSNRKVTPNKRRISGYWELGLTQIHNPVQYSFPTNNNLEATSFSGVLRIPFRFFLEWYVDAGIGVAYLTNEEISTRDLGTRWLFEDRLGLGILLGPRKQYEIGYRLVHFSNAYLADVNQSINLHLLILGYWF